VSALAQNKYATFNIVKGVTVVNGTKIIKSVSHLTVLLPVLSCREMANAKSRDITAVLGNVTLVAIGWRLL